jgi:glutamyl-tRNA reductase
MRHILVVGLNHRFAPIEVRERLAFRREHLPSAFAALRHEAELSDAAILSTCNRVEIYAAVERLDGTVGRLQRFLSAHGGLEASWLADRLYSFTEPQSVRHLFAVASGLDSMVLGEGEILHQVKAAYDAACQHGATGKLFHALFQRALNAAKTVRSQTALGRGGTSIGTVAVELAEKIFGELTGAAVLLIGAGKIGELTLKRLTARGVRDIRVMNRSVERAAELAGRHQAVPLALSELAAQLLAADILISSTSAPAPLLTCAQVAAAMRARRQRPLCIVDLGVPRNVEPSVGTLENVYRFDVDDLQELLEHAHQARQDAVSQSRLIIDRKVERFVAWWTKELGGPCVPSCSAPVAAP